MRWILPINEGWAIAKFLMNAPSAQKWPETARGRVHMSAPPALNVSTARSHERAPGLEWLKSSQVKASQVKSSQVKSSQVKPSQVK